MTRSGWRAGLVTVVLGCCTAVAPGLGAQPPPCQTGKTLSVPKGANGARVTKFVTTQNIPAGVATEAVVKWDDGGLTVIFECADAEIVAKERPRDDPEMWRDDCVEIFLDPGHTHSHKKKWVHMLVSASGGIYDEQGPAWLFSTGEVERGCLDYDARGLKTKIEKTRRGWRAEIALPWDDIGMRPNKGDAWGFNLNREERPGEEYLCWAPTWGPFNRIHQWGEIVFAGEDEDAVDVPAQVGRMHDKVARWRAAGVDPAVAVLVNEKTRGHTMYRKEWIRRARENASNTAWGKEIARRILDVADYWAAKTDRELLDIVPTGNPRALTPGQYYGDPISGGNRFALVTCLETPYRWYNPKTKIWWYDGAKVKNPTTGEEVVVRDDGSGFLQPEGFAHPGARTYFVGAYRGYLIGMLTQHPYHSGAGPDVIPGSSGRRYPGAIPRLAEAYALTGRRLYARKAGILLGRLAELYPFMNGARDDDPRFAPGGAARWLERSTTDYRYLLGFLDGMDLTWDAVDEEMEERMAELFAAAPGPDGKERAAPFKLRQSLNQMMLHAAELCEKFRVDILSDWCLSWVRTEMAIAACTESPELMDIVLFGRSPALESLLMNAYYRDGKHIYDSMGYLVITPRLFLTLPFRTVGFQGGHAFQEPLDLYNDPRFPLGHIISFLSRCETGGLRPTFGDGGSGRNPRPVPGSRIEGMPPYRPAMEVGAAFSEKGRDVLRACLRGRSAEEISDLRKRGDFLTLAFALPAEDLAQNSAAGPLQSSLFEDSCIAFLRCGQRPRTRHDLVMWGVASHAHAHGDKLGLWFGGRGRHLAAAGGGYPFTFVSPKQWAWETHSAPCWVVLVDGERQHMSHSETRAYYAGELFRLCSMENSTAYPGCRQRRTVWLIPGPRDGDAYALDVFEVSGGGRLFDYNTRGNDAGRFEDIRFEFQGETPPWRARAGALAGEDVALYSRPGYGWMKDVRMTATDRDFAWTYDYGGAGLKVHALSFGRKRSVIHALGEVGGHEPEKSPWDPHVLWRDEAPDPAAHETQFVTVLESIGPKPFLSRVTTMACPEGAGGIHPVGVTVHHASGHTDVIFVNPRPGRRARFTDAEGRTWVTDALTAMQRIGPKGEVVCTEVFDGTILKAPRKEYHCHPALDGRVETVDYVGRRITVRLDRPTGATLGDVEGHVGILHPAAGGRLTAYRARRAAPAGLRMTFESDISLVHAYTSSPTEKRAAVAGRPVRELGGREVVVDVAPGDRFRLPLSSRWEGP